MTKESKKQMYVRLARQKWEDEGELEIDDNPKVSISEEPGVVEPERGAYVQAWVWVDNPEWV